LLAIILSPFLVLLGADHEPARALSIRQWSGSAQTPNWSTPGNWVGNAVPVNGDFVTFGDILPNLSRSVVNDIAGLSLARVFFKSDSYAVSGNSLEVREIVGLENAIGTRLSLPITGAGEFIIDNGSTLRLSGNNTFTGRIDVRGVLEVGSNTALGSPAGITRTTTPGSILITPEVTSIGQETLSIQGDGKGINGGFYGALAVFPNPFTINNLQIVGEAVISATGVLNLPSGIQTPVQYINLKLKTGTFVVGGVSNIPNGDIYLTSGADVVWNSSATVLTFWIDPFVLAPGETPPVEQPVVSRLWGGGTTAEATVRAGEVSPRSGNSPTRLTMLDDFSLSNAAFSVLLNGTAPGTGYSQLTVGDLVEIGPGAKLNAQLNFAPAAGQSFRIIDVVRDNVTVAGTFDGLPEGATFSLGGRTWSITYKGGTGNDVVISTAPAAPVDPRPFKRTVPMLARDG